MKENITQLWDSVDSKLKEIAPLICGDLKNGATQEQINELENLVGIKLPSSFIEFYKIHNGQKEFKFDPYISFSFYEFTKLMSIDEIIECWKMWKEHYDGGEFIDKKGNEEKTIPDKEIKPKWWNILWIPFFDDMDCNHYCLDLDPSSEGNFGQVIKMWHDDGRRILISNSFEDWFLQYKNDLVNNKFVLLEDFNSDGELELYHVCDEDAKDNY